MSSFSSSSEDDDYKNFLSTGYLCEDHPATSPLAVWQVLQQNRSTQDLSNEDNELAGPLFPPQSYLQTYISPLETNVQTKNLFDILGSDVFSVIAQDFRALHSVSWS